MFSKILIANRGEIAVRIIRACQELGIATVAVYSEADSDALHVQIADEAVCIGPPQSASSYLNMSNIISATVLKGADAIHPGFGFLSESSKFAKMCSECNITFIGPEYEAIERMGNKSNAIELMTKSGVPVIPGSHGAVEDANAAVIIADKIGYPVMIKASAGGGGRGIRVVESESELVKAFKTAKAEAKTAFGDDTMYVEKFIKSPRHIEFQIVADNYGNTVYLGERDCSIQRRNQKVLEESPSPAVKEKLRAKMGETAVRAAKAINYNNLGTIEFLLDSDENFYFMEMNTRIQVEHPITEMISGIDLVKMQIRISAGEKLKLSQSDIKLEGHAIECRINAEDPEKEFRPSPGKITELHVPGGFGIRMDSAIYNGYMIPPYYDSMLGKLIAYGKDREEAIARMRRALGELVIEGVKNNIDFQYDIISNSDFIKGNYNTAFIDSLKSDV
jgi:acetyl-CoA carboxylase, biotin carboxylase subunit